MNTLKKYKQTVIPEILTTSKTFANLSRKKLNLFAEAYYLKNINGKKIVNVSTGYIIHFQTKAIKKIVKGSALYPYKAMALIKLINLVKYAEFSNYGQAKPTDSKDLLYYLNFKVKCKIDGKITNFRISCKLYKNGKAFYNHEFNIIKSKPRP